MSASEPTREQILSAARDLMAGAGKCAMVTIRDDGAAQARMMDPFPPENDFTVWMATSRETRKVAEIEGDERVTLIYFDPDSPGFVTLLGRVRLVDDDAAKQRLWKDAWTDYYPGGPTGELYLLLEFTPDRLELESVEHDIAADPMAWKPAVVEFART